MFATILMPMFISVAIIHERKKQNKLEQNDNVSNDTDAINEN